VILMLFRASRRARHSRAPAAQPQLRGLGSRGDLSAAHSPSPVIQRQVS